MESRFGQMKEVIPLYRDNMNDSLGSITIYEEGLVVQIGGKLAVPFNYIQNIIEKRKLPLGKVLASMDVYDLLGNKNTHEFVINDLNLQKLKSLCKR